MSLLLRTTAGAAKANTTALRRLPSLLPREAANGIAAPGVDCMTWKDYEADRELRIEDLHERVHRGAYRPQPSHRVYMDKLEPSAR